MSPASPDSLTLLPPGPVPRHVAIIMDGNGRWAEQRGEIRLSGHRRGSSRRGSSQGRAPTSRAAENATALAAAAKLLVT